MGGKHRSNAASHVDDDGLYTLDHQTLFLDPNSRPTTPASPQPQAFPTFEMPNFSMPSFDFEGQLAQQAADNAAAEAQRAEEARLAEERRVRTENYNKIDDLWRGRSQALTDATKYVNDLIASEQSRAHTAGIDYSITDEQRAARISNSFADYWTEANEKQLTALTSKWGNPEQSEDDRTKIHSGDLAYNWTYKVLRGTPTGTVDNTTGQQEIGGKVDRPSGGSTALTGLLSPSEEEKAKKKMILG